MPLTFREQLIAAFPPKPTWSVDQLPDLSSKVILVTGGNVGLGFETVKQLLRKNAKVYLGARSFQKAEEAIQVLRKETGREAHFFPLDLSDLEGIKRSAEEFLRSESRLDALVLNAGIVYPPLDQLTVQGYDLTLGVNVLGHFLLFRLLYPLLAASGTASDPARVVWLSSLASFDVTKVDPGAFCDPTIRQRTGRWLLYAQSKLGAVLLSAYAARMAKARGEAIVYIAVDPGLIKTNIFRGQEPWYWALLMSLAGYPVEKGALTQLFAAAAPEAKEYNGKYMYPFARLSKANPVADDEKLQTQLWEYLESQIEKYLA